MNEKNIIKEIMDIWNRQNIKVKKCLKRIENYDESLLIHCIDVGIISYLIAKKVFKNYSDMENIFIAGLLHDYGKLFLPKQLLDKTGRLTIEERRKINNHTILGYLKLKEENCFNKEILLGVLDHHERINGSGYIGNKTEKEISRYAKIIMIADIYDAMTSDRIYRAKVNKEIASEYLIENAGKTLSKSIVYIFLNLIKTIDIEEMCKLNVLTALV